MKIICENKYGDALTVQYSFPYFYVSCDGLMTYRNDVFTGIPNIVGDVYQGSHNPARNIVLTFAVKHNAYWNVRSLVYKVFAANGVFTWYPDTGEARNIEYYTESIEWSDPNSRGFRYCTVSMICPFPFFKGSDNVVAMSYWDKKIMLPGVFQSPFMIGERVAEQIYTIDNPEPVDVGLVITFTANSGNVVQPTFENVNTGEQFEIYADIPPGNSVIVSTLAGSKKVSWADELTAPEGEPWNYTTNDWITLHPGKNTFRYDAFAGVENLDVTISYNQLYVGG